MSKLTTSTSVCWLVRNAVRTAVLGSVAVSCLAANADHSVIDTLKSKLDARFPNAKIERIQESSWPGVYEIYAGGQIVYADATGDRMLVGNMMDTSTRKNLTEQRLEELTRVDFNSLPFDQAIKIVKGDGSRQLAVFEDPKCPFCHEIEKTFESVDNVSIYVFLYPIESLHSGATDIARDIWCAPDKAAAWQNWMHDKKAPPEQPDCKDAPIDNIQTLAGKLRVTGTPTLFFMDGSRIPGSVSLTKLESELVARSTQHSAVAQSVHP